jgi:hypothetical protein
MILIGIEQIGKTAKEICDDPNCNRTTCNTFYLEDRAFQAAIFRLHGLIFALMALISSSGKLSQ